jgi:tetratricopeptide (TPR) repeat protein
VEQAAASVKDIDYPPLRAEIALRSGVSLELLSEYQKARPALEEAYFTALAANHVPVAIDAAVALVLVTGRRLSTPDVMQMWVRHAEALLQRGGDDRQIARLAANRGLGSFLVADYGNGEARQLKAREFYTEALKTYERHNDLLNIGRLQIAIGETYEYVSPPDYAAAERHFRKAVDSFVLGACEEHPGVALAHTSVGYILRMQHRLAEAEAELKKAGELTAAALGTDHRNYGLTLSGLAAVHMEREELDKAEPLLRRALEIHADREGYEHINTQSAQQSLGYVLVKLGKYDDAVAVAERLMTGMETTKNFNPYMLANASLLLWDAYAGARRGNEVTSRIQAAYDRVAALQKPAEIEPNLLFALAKAHEEADASDARALVLQARSNAEAMGHEGEKLAVFDDWLAQHPARK